MTTTHTLKEIDTLAEMIAGGSLGRSSTKDKALARLKLYAGQNDISSLDLLNVRFDDARKWLQHTLDKAKQPLPKKASCGNLMATFEVRQAVYIGQPIDGENEIFISKAVMSRRH